MLYKYGMRMRGFSIGCQPMQGLVDWEDCDSDSEYYSTLVYDRKLTKEEVSGYELDIIEVIKDKEGQGNDK